jgi:DNA-binding response OmpR family regulator
LAFFTKSKKFNIYLITVRNNMRMQKLHNILIVEDDPNIAAALSHALRSEYQVDTVGTGKMAIYRTDTADYGIIILDLGLPDISGLHVCQQLRERGVTTPILVLSGESNVVTKINLLDAGANDFMSKPFSLGELKARMRVLIRSSRQTAPPTKHLYVADLVLDRKSRTVSRSGIDVKLRRKEFALLECLMEHAGMVVTRDLLTSRAWDDGGSVWTNTVDVHIKHLRDKIDRPFNNPLIKTVHGMGYRLETPESAVIST